MKKFKFEKTFLEELSKVPNISGACNKVGLSRQTVYRWMEMDSNFEKKVNDAMERGINSINDLAESKLISKIKQENFPAIKYWLGNNKVNYIHPRPTGFWDKLFEDNKLSDIKVTIYHSENNPSDLEEDNPRETKVFIAKRSKKLPTSDSLAKD